MASGIELEGISKVFRHPERGDVHAVKQLNLTVQPGELLTLLGPSGCGKTTALRMIAGFENPTTGRILIGGQDVTNIMPNRRNIGFVFQNYALFPHMNTFDNVSYGLSVKGISPADRRKRVAHVLNLVGLEGMERRYPNQLSGGEQQRVAIARALAKNPKLLLCDEPTGALDYNTGKSILKLLQDTCRKMGMTVVVITHNLAITPMGDKVIRVKNGKIESQIINDNPIPVERIEW